MSAAEYAARREALLALDALPLVLNGDDRRLALRQHPLQVRLHQVGHRALRTLNRRVADMAKGLQWVLGHQRHLTDHGHEDALVGAVPGLQVDQVAEDFPNGVLGRSGVSHSNLSVVLQSGDDAESGAGDESASDEAPGPGQ